MRIIQSLIQELKSLNYNFTKANDEKVYNNSLTKLS